MGMVFQDYALFPHMTVFENIAYGLRARRAAQNEIQSRVRSIIEINQLVGLERRYPGQLSGGQQQRVALARALVIRPSVLLMDEALGALDLKLRESMQIEVRRIQRELATTTIHVTHDQTEALTMSDRIIVLNAGSIAQIGTPEELRLRPANRFVAEFVGANNVLPVTVLSSGCTGTNGTIIGVEGARLLCTQPWQGQRDEKAYLILRPEDISMSTMPGPDSFSGRVVATKYIGTNRCAIVEIGRRRELMALDRNADVKIGDQLHMRWSIERAFLVSENGTTAPRAIERPANIRMAVG
jgi:ABC-type Fe3+/spermidine/putrescine transport system ATPase subunit